VEVRDTGQTVRIAPTFGGIRLEDISTPACFEVAADGRSVNNVLGYPGIFRGALMAGASAINLEMKLAAARVLADLAEGDELVPDVLLPEVHDAVAQAVMEAAERSGVERPEMVAVGLRPGRAGGRRAVPSGGLGSCTPPV